MRLLPDFPRRHRPRKRAIQYSWARAGKRNARHERRWLLDCPLSRAMTNRMWREDGRSSALIQGLELDDRGVVVVAGPQRYRRGAVVDEDAADVGRMRKKIFDRP